VRADFGELLRWHRAEAGLTQEELAERSGVSVRAIADMERGRTGRPYRRSVSLLADALMLTGDAREELARSARPAAGKLSPPRDQAAGAGVAGRPRELPADVLAFTGRTAELAELDHQLAGRYDRDQGDRDLAVADHGGPTPAVVISAVSGAAGVGKTALAVRWAHRARARFPDGQVYVNLRGFSPEQPLTAGDALAGLLRSLGLDGPEIPAEVDERAARYRSLMDGRRILVILDNAATAEQVGPLLPGSPSCAVIVTSRDSLAGLVARHGARRIGLDLLPADEAMGLLRTLIGDGADDNPAALARLAGQCARLPLALRIAAELAVARPGVPLASLADELADEQRRLDVLDAGGDPLTAVRAVFSWSCQRLEPSAAWAFGMMGLHPGPDLDAYATAALTGTTVDQARRDLDVLTRAHLAQPTRPGRYSLHDLLRVYARERAEADSTAAGRHAALTQLLDYYLHTTVVAMDALFPAERRRRPSVAAPGTPVPEVVAPDAARAWLDAERASLVAAAGHAADAGWPGHAARLAGVMFRYLEQAGHFPEIIAIGAHACRAARCAGDRGAEAEALLNLTVVDLRQARYSQAAHQLEQALTLYQEAEDRTGQARALGNLGIAAFKQGSYYRAADCYRQALALYRQTGDRSGEPRTLNNLALIDLRQGRYRQAASRLEQVLAIHQQTGDQSGENNTRASLALAEVHLGHHDRASDYLRQALDLCARTRDPAGRAYALICLATADQRRGRDQDAAARLRQALDIYCELGDPSGEAEARNGLGQLALAAGLPADARAQHTAALDLATRIHDTYEQARAHAGLAAATRAAGDLGPARHHWQQARNLYARLGAPEAGPIGAELTQLGT
jgi:tetratricopeptide (TPR) repeat protein/transcriptional regulator with XRE-family HTH domain